MSGRRSALWCAVPALVACQILPDLAWAHAPGQSQDLMAPMSFTTSMTMFRELCADPFPDSERFASMMQAPPFALQAAPPPAAHPEGQHIRRWRSPKALLEYGDNPAATGRMSRSCMLATRIQNASKDQIVADYSRDLALPAVQRTAMDWDKDGSQAMCWAAQGRQGQPLIVTLMLLAMPSRLQKSPPNDVAGDDMLALMVVAKPTLGPDGKPRDCL